MIDRRLTVHGSTTDILLALDRTPPRVPVRAPKGSDETAGRSERVLRCRTCESAIASYDDRIEIAGAHGHTFVNPHGHVFEIGCFSRADGCDAIGPASSFFSWFPGYVWRVAVCRSCRAHLGWSFGDFWGLVLPSLI